MKKIFRNIIFGTIMVIALSMSIPFIIDYMYWIAPLKEIEFVPILSPCDEDCKKINEAKGFTCTKIHTDDYLCREPLRIDPQSSIQIAYVTPIDYGEFIYYHEKTMLDSGMQIEIIDPDTIKIEFSSYDDMNIPNSFAFTSNISKGQMFVKYCTNTTLHTLKFTNIVEVEEKTYIEFWARLANMPDNLACTYPEIIKHSISAFS